MGSVSLSDTKLRVSQCQKKPTVNFQDALLGHPLHLLLLSGWWLGQARFLIGTCFSWWRVWCGALWDAATVGNAPDHASLGGWVTAWLIGDPGVVSVGIPPSLSSLWLFGTSFGTDLTFSNFLNFYFHLGLITTPHALYVHMTYVYSIFFMFHSSHD